MDASNSSKVQHINKKSSDELLRKFADDDGPAPVGKELVLRVSKRRKRRGLTSREVRYCESPLNLSGGASSLVMERKWLLPPATRRSVLLRQLAIGRSQLRAREIIEKTWRRTVEGASRVFMEKHYNRHKRLINDAV